MPERRTFTLKETVANFLETKGNRSAYINKLVLEDMKKDQEKLILAANAEEAEDEDYQEELKAWEITIADGE